MLNQCRPASSSGTALRRFRYQSVAIPSKLGQLANWNYVCLGGEVLDDQVGVGSGDEGLVGGEVVG